MSRDDDPNNDLPQQGVPFGQRDDSPYDDLGDPEPFNWRRVLNWLLLILAIIAIASFFIQKAKAQGYLPPDRYVQREAPRQQPRAQPGAEDPLEYYAEDWVVLNQGEKLVCRDPYIMRDLKVIRCIGTDPVR